MTWCIVLMENPTILTFWWPFMTDTFLVDSKLICRKLHWPLVPVETNSWWTVLCMSKKAMNIVLIRDRSIRFFVGIGARFGMIHWNDCFWFPDRTHRFKIRRPLPWPNNRGFFQYFVAFCWLLLTLFFFCSSVRIISTNLADMRDILRVTLKIFCTLPKERFNSIEVKWRFDLTSSRTLKIEFGLQDETGRALCEG